MYLFTKGSVLRVLQKSIIGAIALIILSALVFISASQAEAQERPKPQLINVQLNASNNDPQALAIAKKLDPEFFNIDREYMDGSPDAAFYARYLPLIPNEPKRFLIVTVTNTLYYCTNFGCPYYIYENHSGNQWRLVLSLQTQKLWYDANTAGNGPDNLVSQIDTAAGSPASVWVWAANSYMKVKR